MNEKAPLLDIRHLKKYFNTPGGKLHAVDDISFTLERGETLGVVGESGCGKSTLGKTILRLTPPTAGEMYFEGQDITGFEGKEFFKMREEMQMIFQDPFASLNPRQSVKSAISEPLIVHKIFKNKKEREDRVLQLMDTVGLARRYAEVYPHELDGGRRQRIGIARALALEPQFIVCDEPVSALDVSIQAQIINLLMDLQEEHNLAYMFITHDLSVVRHISHKIFVCYLGQVVESGPTKTIFDTMLHPYTKALFSAIPVPSLHNRRQKIILKGELTSPIEPKDQCRFAPRCIYAKEECFASCPKLREVMPGHKVACHLVEEVNGFKIDPELAKKNSEAEA